MSFSSIWNRIKSETDIERLNQLAEVVGTTQPYVSRKKKNDHFPVEWAYLVARKYGLLTEWVMTGEGPKRLEEHKMEVKFPILLDINQWLSEIVVNEPFRRDWFIGIFNDAFPMFGEWNKRRDGEESRSDNIPANKIA